jgi:predicted HicB family RNase H-like nuclease
MMKKKARGRDVKKKRGVKHRSSARGAGRPAGSGENYGRVSVRVPKPLLERLHEDAERNGLAFTEWVRETLRRSVDD